MHYYSGGRDTRNVGMPPREAVYTAICDSCSHGKVAFAWLYNGRTPIASVDLFKNVLLVLKVRDWVVEGGILLDASDDRVDTGFRFHVHRSQMNFRRFRRLVVTVDTGKVLQFPAPSLRI